MVFTPTGTHDSPALLGRPLTGGEPASSSSSGINPVSTMLPYPLSKGKGKGKTYLAPPWYEHHFGPTGPPADEEMAPEENVLTLPQQPFELPNDVVHSHRYVIGKGKGGPIVKGKPAYALEFRNDKGKGRQVLPPGTLPSDEDDDAPDGWHEWRRMQEAIHASLDDGAGVGDFDDDITTWREPDPDEMFLPRSRIPGDAPPSGLEDFEPYVPDFPSDEDDGDYREDEDEPEEPGEAMMASPSALQVVDMSPTKVILDLGCTKAMGSRAAVNHFCQRIDRQGHNTYLWYEIKPTTSQFSFANSQTSKCTDKLVVYMSGYYGSIHCTEFDIVEEGQVPFLMSLPQMRSLRFSLNLTPGNASLTCDPPAIGYFQKFTPCVGS